MIEIKNGVKKYGKVLALDGINISFEEDKIIVLLGLNGVGKSIILKSILGLTRLTKGEILIDGEKLNYKAHEKIALIPDVEVYYGHMTIKESFIFIDKFYKYWNMNKAYEMLIEFKLDEPFSGIDLFTRESFILSMIKNINDNMTIILTTHEVYEIENIADEVILLNEGRVVSKFNVEEIKEEGLSIIDKMKEFYKNEISY